MPTEIEDDDESRFIRIPLDPGSTKSSLVRAFYGELDRWGSERSTGELQSQDDPGDPSPDEPTERGSGGDPDEGQLNSGPGGEADNQGESELSDERLRSTSDEGTPGDTGDTPVEAGEPDVVETPAERDSAEDTEQADAHGDFEFFIPAFEACGRS